jgi:hypothetical protein
VTTNARFVSWLRGALPPAGALTVNASGHSVNVPVSRYGPGDVIGIAASLIKTRSPGPDSIGMTPNLFPYVEFTVPDLPWWVTPGDPDAKNQLTPWLTLLVIEASSGSPLGNAANAKLPVVNVDPRDLPPSDELAEWAHVQISSDGAANETTFRGGTARTLSPRALRASTRYVVCLVPAFEAGRLAGLGQVPTDPMSATLAWSSSSSGAVLLPVYDHWFFTTGPSGDFETLARKLKGRDIASSSVPLALNVAAVSGNVPGKLAPFEGALRPVGSEAAWTGAATDQAKTQLSAWMQREGAGSASTPVLGPPIYGSIETGKTSMSSGWSSDLNLDPRRRAAAGLGTEIVRRNQDGLTDEAWRQIGDLERARREHAGARLADIATLRLHIRMVAPLGGAHALVTLSPALRRMKDASAGTFAARLGQSKLESASLSGSFRRVMAAKTPAAARRAGHGVARTLPVENARAFVPGAAPPSPPNLVTDAQLQKAVLGHTIEVNRSGAGRSTGDSGSTTTRKIAVTVNLSDNQVAILKEAAGALDAEQPEVVEVTAPEPFAWIAPVAPAVTAAMRFEARVNLASAARVRSGSVIVATPRFDEPLAEWLDPAYLLAGVNLPPDTAGLLEVNSPFIEALMVGANHELDRELAWRGVPLDRASTPLTRFFGSTGSAPPRDLAAIASWKDADPLGSHVTFGERAVLILRSRLVGHLSEALIYLAQAVPDGPYRKPGGDQLPPVFRGTAGVDTAYLGFEIAPEALGGSGTGADLGWYVVIQEIEGAPRFGFDEPSDSSSLNTWNDVAWPMVGLTASGDYVSIGTKMLNPATPGNLVWGGGSAHMASICLQRPVRLSIHASILLPPKK